MSFSMDTQRIKLMHLENTLGMYRIYNAETLEKLVETVHVLHSGQTLYENLFAGKQQQPTKHIHKCMAHVVSSIMQLIQCSIYEQ